MYRFLLFSVIHKKSLMILLDLYYRLFMVNVIFIVVNYSNKKSLRIPKR